MSLTSPSLTFTITGTPELRAALAKIGANAQQAAAAALYQEAEAIMGESKEKYVPVDDSPLKNSGFVKPQDIDGSDIGVTLGFGGAASAYAIAVHEHLSKYSPPSWKAAEKAGRPVKFSPEGRGPKYLEIPFLAAGKDMAKRLADRIRGNLG
jgi:hypothetical protein